MDLEDLHFSSRKDCICFIKIFMVLNQFLTK